MNPNRHPLHDQPNDALERMIRAARAQPSPEDVKHRVLQAAAAFRKLAPSAGCQPQDSRTPGDARVEPDELGRSPRVSIDVSQNQLLDKVKNMIRTHKRLTAATAVLTTLAAGLILYAVLFSPSAPAYALDETVKANHQVTSYHAKLSPSSGGIGEVWVQLNPDGSPLRARIDFPQTEDGAKVVICSEGKAAVWFKDKNGYAVVPEKNALDRVREMQKLCDPRLAFEDLQAREKAGKVKIETTAPAKEGDFIKLTVTPTDASNRKEVYEVNPTTKLAQRVTYYERQGDQWKETKLIEYLDYRPIDPKVFHLDLPKDVLTTNQIQRKPGLVKGDLSDEEMAKKVAREFFEALMANDYEKAGLILEGTPADKMKKMFGKIKFSRIVEIGTPSRDPKRQALVVPVKVDCELPTETGTKPLFMTARPADAETVTKSVRQFFEALLARDYPKADRIAQDAGLVFKGAPADAMKDTKKFFDPERVALLRIVEIGKPVPRKEDGSMEVATKVELEVKSRKGIQEFRPAVRPPYGQPDRRVICGGI